MARRSPMNARYQKHTGPEGKTRKSSAAAKPSRKSGSTASSSTEKKSTTRTTAYVDPQTPDFKRVRRMWWISLGGGLVLVALSFGVRTYFKTQAWANVVGGVALVLAYAAIFFALYLDWTKMRPMRKAHQAGGSKPAKPEKS